MTISKYKHTDEYIGQSLYDDLERAKLNDNNYAYMVDDATGERWDNPCVPDYVDSQGDIQQYCVNVLGYSGLSDAVDDHAVCTSRLPFYEAK